MPGPSFPSRFGLQALLGEGGSGRVYRVHDSVRSRDLALKLVTPAESAFLRREFNTLRQIHHENLVQVFDWGTLASGEAYYTMELIEGKDWGRRMGSPQSADEVRHILTGLLRGLAHLHCHGEIHGDIKPGNVLLGLGGVVKLSDVGMGGSEGTAAGVSGTPGYAAPEVWEGARADERSDLYSVGVMAYESLTGRHPFAGKTVREVVAGQLEGWAPSPETHGVRVPTDLARVVMRALERDRALRQGNADEFMDGMGAEDPVGGILGGRLVGRDSEIADLLALLRGKAAGDPTLLAIAGTSWDGRIEFLRELSSQVGARGWSLASLNSMAATLGRRMGGAAGSGTHDSPSNQDARSLSALAATVWAASRETPVLIDAGMPGGTSHEARDLARSLGRYLWAMSLERGEPARFLCVSPDSETEPGDEELTLRLTLPPLALADFESALRAVLGRVEFSADLLQKLHGITGGDPGLIGALVDGLIRQRLIHRSQGVWKFCGEQDVQSIALPELRNRWDAAWEQLDDSDRDLLTLLALCPRSLLDRMGARILRDLPGFQRLAAMGWLQSAAGGWGFSSESARAVVDELALVERRRRLALAILSDSSVDPSREERADLLLETGRFPEAVAESAWAAEAARTRGDFRAALRRLDHALSLALRESDVHRAREVALLLADAAHASGLLDRADAALSDPTIWGDAGDSMVDRTRRSLLLGLVAKSRGQFPDARRHLADAIDACPGGEPRRDYLRAVVELSEVDWRHSDEAARLAAIDQLSSSLRLVPDSAEYADLRGAILYGLGAARFLAGRFQEAKEVLAGGLAEPVPDLFRIRMSNALAMTVGRLGDFAGALRYLDDAWDIAERSGLDDFRPRLLSSRGAVLSRMGRAREAGEQDLLSARWARRLGNRFEYIAGCSGAATNLVASAAYEEAIRLSRGARDAAKAVGSRIYVLKECETEALAFYCMGLHDEAERMVREGLAPLSAESDVQVKPRLLWLLGKVLLDRADTAGAEAALGEAKQLLATAPDSEDLLGVEIELHRLRAAEDPQLHTREIGRILSAEVDRENWSVVLPGAVILAEIGRGNAVTDGDHIHLFTKALARAEEYGWREVAWRLSGTLGLRYLRGGEGKLAQTRLAHATRVLREVASDLSAEHQRAYLSLPHVRALLEAGRA